MKLVLDDFISEELKEYLLLQLGIIDVKISQKKDLSVLEIKHNEKTTPDIIMKYIELFQNNKFSILFEFNKCTTGNFKKLKYIVDDMCCDYCYRGLVMDLFDNENVKSVTSNYDFNKPAYNIEFTIEYDDKYSEDDLIKYINEKYN